MPLTSNVLRHYTDHPCKWHSFHQFRGAPLADQHCVVANITRAVNIIIFSRGSLRIDKGSLVRRLIKDDVPVLKMVASNGASQII